MSTLLHTASVTSGLVTFATHVIRDLGLAGVFLLILMTAVVFVPGTEPIMLFAGFDVYQGHLSLIGIIVAGVLGDLIGASIAYAIGRAGLVEVLERLPWLHLGPKEIERAHGWFDRWGSPVIAVSRCLPGARAAFPYAAGIVKMPFGRFLAMAALGSIVWITALGLIGRQVGHEWPQWKSHLDIVDYVVAVVIVVIVVWWLIRRVRAARTAL